MTSNGEAGSAATRDTVERLRSTMDRDAVAACARDLLGDASLGATYLGLLSALDGFTDEQRSDAGIPEVKRLDDHLDALTSRVARDDPGLTKREVARAIADFAASARARAGLA